MAQGEPLDVYDVEGLAKNRIHFRGEPVPKGDYHLCVHIWIVSAKGNYLIQKRAETVATSPGIWATTAGAVRAGETPRGAAVRELEEEIGLIVEPHRFDPLFQSRKDHLIATVWLVKLPHETDRLTLQPEEVTAVKWSNRAEIETMVRGTLFLDYGPDYFAQLFKRS